MRQATIDTFCAVSRLSRPTAASALDLIYRPGITCSKCSILLTYLSHRGEMTADLFAPAAQAGSDKLMAALM